MLALEGTVEETLTVTPIDPYEDHLSRRRAQGFASSLRDWLTSPSVERGAPSLGPPLDLHPETLLDARFASASVAILGVVVALDLVAVFWPLRVDPASAYFAFEVLGRAGAVGTGWLVARELGRTVLTHRLRSKLGGGEARAVHGDRAE